MDGSEKQSQRVDDQVVPSEEQDEQVIVIGWQALLIPLVILTIAGGYYAGRMLRGDAATAQAPTSVEGNLVGSGEGASLQLDAPAVAEAPVVITIDPNQLGFDDSVAQPLPPSNHPLVGRPAPTFTMNRLDTGEALPLESLRGQTVMINFWATWCPPCRYEMPWLQSVYEKYGGSFELLAVDAGEKVTPDQVTARVQQFVDRMGLSFPVLMGDNTYLVQRDFGVYGLPATFIIDAEGNVVDHHGGMYPNEATLEAQLLKHLQPVDTESGG